MSNFYKDVTVPAAWGNSDDFGFVPRALKLTLQSGGPVEYSFDAGVTTAGILGPSATRPMTMEHTSGKSRIWFKGAAAPVVSVWAWA